MTEGRAALIKAHHNNIQRYQRLLRTHLTDVERRYIESRLIEEISAVQTITLPQSSAGQTAQLHLAEWLTSPGLQPPR